MKSSKVLLLILSLVALLLLAFLSLDVYNIRLKNKETSRLLNQVEQATMERTLFQAVRTLQETGTVEIEAFNNLILTDERLVPTFESIEKAGRALGLKTAITSVDKVDGANGGGPQQINLSIETEGTWAGSLAFLHAVESLPHRVIMNDVDFSKRGELWLSRINISLYSFN